MKVAVVGLGYVGLSLATLLSKNNEVVGLDVDDDRVYNVNKRKVPIKDKDIERFFRNEKLDFYATLDYKEAFTNKEFIIICTPTNYDEEKNICRAAGGMRHGRKRIAGGRNTAGES